MRAADTEPERTGRPRPIGAWLVIGAVGLSSALSSCRVIEANAWNLRQVHDSDGTPSRRGELHGDMEHVAAEIMARITASMSSSARSSEVTVKQDRIADPLGVCHRNLLELSRGDRDDRNELTLMVEFVTWLSGDCTYALSRERCALELGDLGRRFGASEPRALAEDDVPADADAVRAALEPLLADVKGSPSDASLEAACAGIRALTLDRNGVRRAIAVTNLVLKSGRGAFEPVERLHEELGRRALELSLGVALDDRDARVRAAALQSWAKWSGGESPLPVAFGFRDGQPETVLAALRLLSKYGAPLPEDLPTSGPVTTAEAYWIDRVVVLLTRLVDGPVQVAACRAMARLSGLPEDLHPESWVRWWQDELTSRAASSSSSAPERSAP